MATSKKIALRWIEVLLILTTILSSMSMYYFWKQQAKENQKYALPAEDSFKNNQFYSSHNLKISRIEARIIQHKEILRNKEMLQTELEIMIATIKGKFSCLPDSLKSGKADSAQIKYCSLLEQAKIKKTEIDFLDTQLLRLNNEVLALNLIKTDSQKAELRLLTAAKNKIVYNRSMDIFLYTLISLSLLYLVLFFFMGWKKGVNIFNWRKGTVLGISAGVLFILFTYEVFGLYGPLGLCLVTLVLVIILILGKKSDQPEMNNK